MKMENIIIREGCDCNNGHVACAVLGEVVFEWRDRFGDNIKICDMNTKRLFYTWLMIWNHIVPENYRIWNNHRYSFDRKIYTKDYIKHVFKEMYVELKNRDDIGYKSKQIFNQIDDMIIKKVENHFA